MLGFTALYLPKPDLINIDCALRELVYPGMAKDFGIEDWKIATAQLDSLKKEADMLYYEEDEANTAAAAHKYLDIVASFLRAGLPLAPDTTLADKLNQDMPEA